MLPAISNRDPGDEAYTPPEWVKCPDCNRGNFVEGACTNCGLQWADIQAAVDFMLVGASPVAKAVEEAGFSIRVHDDSRRTEIQED